MANLRENVGVKYYQNYGEAKEAFGKRIMQTLINFIYRYLEENEKVSFIKNLQMFADSINSIINWSIVLAPKDVMNAGFLTLMYKRMKLQNNM